MPTLRIKNTDRITICGLPGSGKTVLGKYFASLAEPNVLVYDPLAQYTNFPKENVYIPKTNSQAEFDAVCKRLCARSNCLFIVEECERYIGQGRELGYYAFDLINRGRNWGIGIIGITRRIQRISKDFFDLCQHVIFFRCGLKSREYISDMIGREQVNKIMNLPPYHFLAYNLETEEAIVATLVLGATQRIESKGLPKESKTLAPY